MFRWILVFGCVALTGGGTGYAFGAGAISGSSPITFSEHVAPLVFENCTSCHRPGEAAPFPLITFEDARKHAKQIVEVTSKKIMPPWHADAPRDFFAHDRRLTGDQIKLISDWVTQGTAEGNPAKLPAVPKFPEGWQLGEPDLVVKMPVPFPVRAEGKDSYRYFVLPLNLTEDKWVRAIEFRPSARSVVHHCLFFLDDTGTARKLDEATPEPGYSGGGRKNRTFTPIGGWALGSNPRALPGELAWFVPKNSDLVLQTHFHMSGKPEAEASTVGIYFAEGPPQRSFVGIQLPPMFGSLSGMDIPAGTNRYVVTDTFKLPVDAEAFAVGGHAHYLGKTMHLTATLPEGAEKDLLKIPDWEFNWQEQYSYKDRVRLPKGTIIRSEIIYDNSESNPRNPTSPPKRVRWGPMSTDEMGSLTVQVMPVHEEDLKVLKNSLRHHIADVVIDTALRNPIPAGDKGAIVRAMLEKFDKDGDGKLSETEREDARKMLLELGVAEGRDGGTF